MQHETTVPAVQDRLVQTALLQVFQPVLVPVFHAPSYASARARAPHHAVATAQAYIHEGYDWVMDLDWEAFFDHVSHDRLMSRLGERVPTYFFVRTAFLRPGKSARQISHLVPSQAHAVQCSRP